MLGDGGVVAHDGAEYNKVLLIAWRPQILIERSGLVGPSRQGCVVNRGDRGSQAHTRDEPCRIGAHEVSDGDIPIYRVGVLRLQMLKEAQLGRAVQYRGARPGGHDLCPEPQNDGRRWPLYHEPVGRYENHIVCAAPPSLSNRGHVYRVTEGLCPEQQPRCTLCKVVRVTSFYCYNSYAPLPRSRKVGGGGNREPCRRSRTVFCPTTEHHPQRKLA